MTELTLINFGPKHPGWFDKLNGDENKHFNVFGAMPFLYEPL